MVTGYALATTFDAAENVTVVARAPGAGTTLAGKICTVTPLGSPETVSVMAALKVAFGVVVTVTLLEAPAATLIDVAEDVSVNVGAGATVTETEFVCDVDPLLAVTVMG